ncbi:hypothetical protein EMPS_08489 [Entomortierella parvispora]|uniref:Uncharacterized protein n=1 Tax=Entomortierella parvispora TaxID=205924 RepID=A0A9P3HGG6_9FUNG|nr:hypothetical protein EMPS_08489 [Entomortierella parvispora]
MSIASQPSTHSPKRPELKATASFIQKRDHFPRVFKDPPNAVDLLARVYPTESELTKFPHVEINNSAVDSFHLFQFGPSGKNCEHIFRAVVFLCHYLRGRAHLLDPASHFSTSKDGQDFKDLATDLTKLEPSLVGVSASSLVALYERIVLERRKLDTFLSQAVGVEWTDTHLSKLARDLVQFDNDIKARDTQRKSATDNSKEAPREGGKSAQDSEKATILVASGLESRSSAPESAIATTNAAVGSESSSSTVDLQTKEQKLARRNSKNTEQGQSALPLSNTASYPVGGIVITSTTLPSGAGVAHPSQQSQAVSTSIQQSAPVPIQPAKAGLSSQLESLGAQPYSNQGSQSPSYTHHMPTSVPSPVSRNNDRKRAAAVSVDIEIVKYLREEIFGIIRSEIEKVNQQHHILRTEIENINARHLRLEEAFVQSQKALRARLDLDNTNKTYHDYQLAVLGRDLRNTLDRIQVVESRVGLRPLPIDPVSPHAMATPHPPAAPQQQNREGPRQH